MNFPLPCIRNEKVNFLQVKEAINVAVILSHLLAASSVLLVVVPRAFL